MRIGKSITLGLIIGAVLGGVIGFILPEARHQPIVIGIFAAAGAIAGTGIGFAIGLMRRTKEEREQGTGLEGISEAAQGRGSIGFGLLIIVVAVLWFFGGLMANRIYFYPPILLIFGLLSIVRSLMAKNQ